MDWLRSLVARNPRNAMRLGKGLLLAGGILILGAMFARFELMDLNAQRSESRLPLVRTLAEAWPQYPTWMVPEGPVGFVIAGALVVAGLAVYVLAEQAVRR
jgi:hypothetical protein